MRTPFLPLIFLLLSLHGLPSWGQSTQEWPQDAVTLNLSSVVLISTVGVQYEHSWHRPRSHWGINTGLSYVMNFWDPAWVGWTASGVFWTGQRNHHFEAKAGLAALFPTNPYWSFAVYPLIQVGYRFQRPKKPWFFTAGIGTSGLNLGTGYYVR